MPGHLTDFVLHNASRILSWIDRRPNSLTYGCSDRNFWHYKIVDFPCSMLQETSLSLALLYSVSFEGNIYFKNSYIKNLAIAQVKYWEKIQNNNGSFDEFFPNEQSFSSTAFTLYSSCLTLKILNEDPDKFYRPASQACKFLVNYGHPGASNQVAAAIAAISAYSDLFSDNQFVEKTEILLDNLLESFSEEGWSPEYGGFDFGYQSITASYLADYYLKNPSDKIECALIKMVEFLACFVHPDGSGGGEYGSRSTSFLAPFGIAVISKKSDFASTMLSSLFINEKSNINNSIDDRYACHFILPSYLFTINLLKDKKINKHG